MATKNTDHCVMRDSGFMCMHCDAQDTLVMPISLPVYLAASKAFVKLHAGCKARRNAGEQCAFCLRRGHSYMECTSIDTPNLWKHEGQDTGMSSTAIYLAAVRGVVGRGSSFDDDSYPYDPSDFGRCHRLLTRFPELACGLATLAAARPVWALLKEAWPALTKLYEQELPSGNAPKLYRRMQQIIAKGEAMPRPRRSA